MRLKSQEMNSPVTISGLYRHCKQRHFSPGPARRLFKGNSFLEPFVAWHSRVLENDVKDHKWATEAGGEWADAVPGGGRLRESELPVPAHANWMRIEDCAHLTHFAAALMTAVDCSSAVPADGNERLVSIDDHLVAVHGSD
jgi:hypothetical protein